MLYHCGKYVECIKDCERALAQCSPQRSPHTKFFALSCKGKALVSLKKLEEAADTLEKAIQFFPQHPSVASLRKEKAKLLEPDATLQSQTFPKYEPNSSRNEVSFILFYDIVNMLLSYKEKAHVKYL